MNRMRSFLVRFCKQRPSVWMSRHAQARARAWAILSKGQPSVARLERFERNLGRLLALSPPWLRSHHVAWSILTTPVALFPTLKAPRRPPLAAGLWG